MKRITLTLCLITDNGKVLLGFKKRGFGSGLWNGFGGKVDTNETIEEAVHREVLEEAGVGLETIAEVGTLEFTFQGKEDEVLEVHVYRGEGVRGEPFESEEMRPQWFAYEKIPYDAMWPDDIFWLPQLLEGKSFNGSFYFGENNKILDSKVIFDGEE